MSRENGKKEKEKSEEKEKEVRAREQEIQIKPPYHNRTFADAFRFHCAAVFLHAFYLLLQNV